ncbi:MAG: DUF1801 domain-containing protein [Taibaiella sp.]|nr:DUF1801 domain-containing protein [Taibaiella sp.]
MASSKNKTSPTGASVEAFINALPEQKKQDSNCLINMIREVTGHEPYMWGPTIIGFGNYHYKYESGREGDAPLAGFSPRKAALSLYFEPEFPGRDELLAKLGKHKAAVACVYVNKLADIDLGILKKMTIASVKHTKKKYPGKKK